MGVQQFVECVHTRIHDLRLNHTIQLLLESSELVERQVGQVRLWDEFELCPKLKLRIRSAEVLDLMLHSQDQQVVLDRFKGLECAGTGRPLERVVKMNDINPRPLGAHSVTIVHSVESGLIFVGRYTRRVGESTIGDVRWILREEIVGGVAETLVRPTAHEVDSGIGVCLGGAGMNMNL